MKRVYQNELLRAEPPPAVDPIMSIIDFWVDLQRSGDAGCTTWERLDRLSDEVTQCLLEDPPNVTKASGLTAKAMLMIEGFDAN